MRRLLEGVSCGCLRAMKTGVFGDAPQAQSAKPTTPRFPRRRGTSIDRGGGGSSNAWSPRGDSDGSSSTASSPARLTKRKVQPGARGVGFLDPPYWHRRPQTTPMNADLPRNKIPDRDPSPACPCWVTLGFT